MSQPFFSRRTVFGITGALLTLVVFFFLMPSVLRGARMAVAGKKNNIKDWLPDEFRETVELEWFAQYFMGESFVIATWEGCTTDDQRLGMFASKLRHESLQRAEGETEDHRRARQLAEELELFLEPSSLQNWGGLDEKWFATPSGQRYYITPDGRFYRWEEGVDVIGGASRLLRRALGTYTLKGQLVTAFGGEPEPGRANEFYNDPSLLAASLFGSVQTGTDLVAQLAAEGGPLWPIDFTDVQHRAAVAQDRAVQRLTGTLFAPAVPENFAWTADAIRKHVSAETAAALPADFDQRATLLVEQISQRFGGTIQGLQEATIDEQAEAWDELFQGLDVPTPPRQTCVIVTLTRLGKENLPRAVGRGVAGAPRGRLLILADQAGLGAAPPPSMAPPPFDRDERELAAASGRTILRLGGPAVDNVAIDEEGTVTLIRLVGYSALVGLGLAFFCFRSVNMTLMVFVCGVSSAILGLAVVYWAGGHVDAILMTMPALVYVLGLSGSIHIVNYYRDEVRMRGTDGAAGRAVRHALTPCTLAAFTTALGVMSLCTSNIVPIYNFGLFTGIAVMAALLILFSYLPAALETFPPKFTLRQREREETRRRQGLPPVVPPNEEENHNDWIAEFWARFATWVTAHYKIVTVCCLAVFAIGAIGLPQIRTSVQLLKLFDADSRIIDDYTYLEGNFGKLVPMELVMRVPPEMIAGGGEGGQETASSAHPLTLLGRLEAINHLDTAVRRTLGESGTGVVGRTMSAVTFLPTLPPVSNSYSPVRGRFESQLSAALHEFADTDFFRVEQNGPFAGSELWRISLRVGALSDVDYGQFVGDLRRTVTPVLDAYRARAAVLDAVAQYRSQQAASGGAAGGKAEPPRILLIGAAQPRPMEEEDFLAIEPGVDRHQAIDEAITLGRQSDLIRTDQLYLATLGELLAGERIRRPLWLDLNQSEGKVQPGNQAWDRLMDAVDVVVLVNDQPGLTADTLAAEAKLFVDARQASFPTAAPMLLGDVPSESDAGPLQAIYTGIVPVVYKAQRTLLESLIASFILAFFLILIVMVILLTPGKMPWALLQPKQLGVGLVAGLISMLPNLFPVVIIFGLMGHGGVLVDIGTMMTASVAMGVAVDDTIHFLTWFREYIDRGLNRVQAVIETFRRVGAPMIQTTCVGGLGLFVFSLSTFAPTQRFGVLMLVLLVTAAIGDLLLFPALLVGPLGKWFRPRPVKQPADPPPESPSAAAPLPGAALATPGAALATPGAALVTQPPLAGGEPDRASPPPVTPRRIDPAVPSGAMPPRQAVPPPAAPNKGPATTVSAGAHPLPPPPPPAAGAD